MASLDFFLLAVLVLYTLVAVVMGYIFFRLYCRYGKVRKLK